MKYLTDFADQAVVLPLVFAVAAVLALQGWRRGALMWITVVASTLLATLAFKVIFLGCSPVFGPLDMHSPSGHVAAATVVTGGLGAILMRRRAGVLALALLAGTVIGISRLVLGAHSLPEVMFGAVIGLTGAAVLVRYAGAPPRLRLAPLTLVVVMIAMLFHGLHLPAEAAIRHAAFEAGRYIPACRAAPVPHRLAPG